MVRGIPELHRGPGAKTGVVFNVAMSDSAARNVSVVNMERKRNLNAHFSVAVLASLQARVGSVAFA